MIDISKLTDLGKKGVDKIKDHFKDITIEEAALEFTLLSCGLGIVADVCSFWNMFDIIKVEKKADLIAHWAYENDMRNYQNIVVNGNAIQAIVDHLSHDYPGLQNAVDVSIRDTKLDFMS